MWWKNDQTHAPTMDRSTMMKITNILARLMMLARRNSRSRGTSTPSLAKPARVGYPGGCGPVFFHILKAHDVVSRVHVNGFAGYSGAEIGGQEQSSIAHFSRFDVAFQRRALGLSFQHFAETSHCASRQSLDWTGRNGIHTDLPWSETVSQVTDAGFERRLGHAHHIVGGHDFFRSEIRKRHNAAAVGHHRRHCPRERNQGIDAGFLGN